MDEKFLIQKAMKGNLFAFNQLVLAYQDPVFNMVSTLLGDPVRAEDVTQETFLLAFHKVPGFRGGSFRVWLFHIATNACYDESHRLRVRWELAVALEDKFVDELDSPSRLADRNFLVEERVSQRESYIMAKCALEGLPLKFRSVVMLVDVMGLNYAEATQVLKISLGTLKSRLTRARMNLRSELQDEQTTKDVKMPISSGSTLNSDTTSG